MKKTLLTLLTFSTCALSTFALAADLTLVNKTSSPSTSRINDNIKCSDQLLGPMGTTPPGATRVLSKNIMIIACKPNLTNCKADVYMAPNCQGEKIATLFFNINSGFPSAFTLTHGKYTITGSGFHVRVDEKK